MLLMCCTPYVSKFRKLSSGHRTGKCQFSFQPQRRAVPKNVQTIMQLCSFHMLGGASLIAQLVKNLPAMQETWVWSLGWEDALEKGKAGVFSTPVFWPGEFPGSVDHGVTKTWTQLSDFHFTSPWLDLVWEIQISFGILMFIIEASQVASLPLQETQEIQVWSLGLEDPLEEEMVPYSSILAWKIL